MSKLTRKYIKTNRGKVVSWPSNKSITIQFDNRHDFLRMKKKLKYQSKWVGWGTGYQNRLNLDR